MISIPTAILVFGLGFLLGVTAEEWSYNRRIAESAESGLRIATPKGLYDVRLDRPFGKKP